MISFGTKKMAATTRTWNCLRKLLHRQIDKGDFSLVCIRLCANTSGSDSHSHASDHTSQLFAEARVQSILQRITRLEVEKVFRTRKEPLDIPKYRLLTDEQLKKVQQDSLERMHPYLQPPPVLPPREPIDEVLSNDDKLDQHDRDGAKFVFTDISFGLHDRDRLMVVREPDGILRKASWEERHHMNQIYHPTEGRKIQMPQVFKPEYLEAKLEAGSYIYILDRATVQFDPDDPEYIRVVERAYDHINTHHCYEVLRSTRHFGNMAFYLVRRKNIDYLLVDMIQKDYLTDASDLVKLFTIVHPDCKTASTIASVSTDDYMTILKSYIENDAIHEEVELALESYEDEQNSALSS